jgi:hypothetical protein
MSVDYHLLHHPLWTLVRDRDELTIGTANRSRMLYDVVDREEQVDDCDNIDSGENIDRGTTLIYTRDQQL